MAHSPDILIVTTRSDVSLDFFLGERVWVAYIEDEDAIFTSTLKSRRFGTVYIRDPFNTGKMTPQEIAPKIQLVEASHPEALYVDGAHTVQDVLIEDKWNQYLEYRTWMPQTHLGGDELPTKGPLIAKKRISARSRDIQFSFRPELLSKEWIVQERLEIIEELRVYILFGRPVLLAAQRRPKEPHQATKVAGTRLLSDDEVDFVTEITMQMKEFDLVGLDIARTPSGIRLIELNRSPQFRRYNELTRSNLVKDFWPELQKHRGLAI